MSRPLLSRALDIDESQVRRLCGEKSLARAQALVRERHVTETTVQENTLRAGVFGTWRRVYRAAVSVEAGRLVPSCSCGTPGFCQHVGAVLLTWIEDRKAFATKGPTGPASMGSLARFAPFVDESPQAELKRLFEYDTLPHLRDVARLRKANVSGHAKKMDYIQALVPVLSDGTSIDAALATLQEAHRRALEVVHILEPVGYVTEAEIRSGCRAWGGSSADPPILELGDLGLLVLGTTRQSYSLSFRVPRVVASRLRLADDLAQPLADVDRAERAFAQAREARPALGVGELLLIVAEEIGRGHVQWNRPTTRERQQDYPGSMDFHVDPVESAFPGNPKESASLTVRFVPNAGLFASADLERLAAQIGQSAEAVWFVAHLLVKLGIVESGDRPTVRQDLLQGVLDLPTGERLGLLGRAWLSMDGVGEVRQVLGDSGPLQMRGYRGFYGAAPNLMFGAVQLRGVVSRAVGRMVPGVWYEFESFLDRVYRLAPGVLSETTAGYGYGSWWLADHDEPIRSLHLKKPIDWDRLRAAVISATLAGALSWLGMVDLASERGGPIAFRVRPEAGALVEREVPASLDDVVAGLVVSDDLTVLVPAGTPGIRVHAALLQLGEMTEFSPAGLRYRLTPEKAQALFDAGVRGEQLLSFLTERSRAPLSAAVRATLGSWWTNYGTVRLYDDLTLIELDDDLLLAELLATTSLRSRLIHAFSPRVIAVEPGAVEMLVLELTRLGHAPRVVEEG